MKIFQSDPPESLIVMTNVKLVQSLKTTVKSVISTDTNHQDVHVSQVSTKPKTPKNVKNVLTNVSNVPPKSSVSNVEETESKNQTVSVQMELGIPVKKCVPLVDTDVSPVPVLNIIVTHVSELELLLINVHVQVDTMKIKMI